MVAMIKPPDLSTWIGGNAEPCALPDGHMLCDPNTGEEIQPTRSSSPSQVERAIEAAHQAHAAGEWSGSGVAVRAGVLRAFADELARHSEEIAVLDAVNSGVPISVTRLFGTGVPDIVRGAADRLIAQGDEVVLPSSGQRVVAARVPWGPTALILPWNAPVFMAVKKLSYALAAGAAAVVKPSSASPWSAQLVVAAAQRAGLPEGVVNLVNGGSAIGGQLVADPRIRAISMTGSTPTGRSIATAAGQNLTRLQLELGSNNPAIVRADADLDVTAAQLISGAMKLSGQWCEAPRRVLVAQQVLDDLVEALLEHLRVLRVASSLKEETDIGPVAFAARRSELEAQREALVGSGGRALTVDAPTSGSFFAPTIVVGADLMLREEVFGPMLIVEPVRGDREAIARANVAPNGLAGYVFTRDEEVGHELGKQLVAGEVKINGTSVLDMSPESAQGFFGSSGIGGHGDADLLRSFSGWRVVGSDAPGLPI